MSACVALRDAIALLADGRTALTLMRRAQPRSGDTVIVEAALAALARDALAEAAAGRIRPVIGQELELDRAADAHTAIEARTTIGKTLLTVAR